jgi:putative ABC transport system permease protein
VLARFVLRRSRAAQVAGHHGVLTLSLGIGANTAIFSMVYGVILRPLSFKDAQQLYTLWERTLKMGYEQNPTSTGNVRDWSARNHVFEHIAAFDSLQTFNLIGKSNPERVEGAAVSPSLFDLLGFRHAFGNPNIPRRYSLHTSEGVRACDAYRRGDSA